MFTVLEYLYWKDCSSWRWQLTSTFSRNWEVENKLWPSQWCWCPIEFINNKEYYTITSTVPHCILLSLIRLILIVLILLIFLSNIKLNYYSMDDLVSDRMKLLRCEIDLILTCRNLLARSLMQLLSIWPPNKHIKTK